MSSGENETLFNSFVGLRCPAEDYDDYGFVLVVESARRVIVGLFLSGAAAGLFPFGIHDGQSAQEKKEQKITTAESLILAQDER